MSSDHDLSIWGDPGSPVLPATITDPKDIAAFAKQMSQRERGQVLTAFSNHAYEMATSFVWGRAMAALKRELANLGVAFLGELLGRPDIVESANVLDAISEKEAIQLAEELGVVSQTEALRLRHSQELVAHFSQRDPSDGDEEMEATEAVSVLKCCVRSVLAKPRIEVAQKFADFRRDLESRTFQSGDGEILALVQSPYFYRKLAISVLLSGIKGNVGAKLEHCLANLNVVLPAVWETTLEPERWQVGKTYAQVHADGLQTQTTGIKHALLKVQGFDYVPENLRSTTFIKAAEAIIRAHEGINNFYNEEGPVSAFASLGTVIPAPAIPQCMTALLCVSLGNGYGHAWSAEPVATRILKKQTTDRWKYYIERVLPGDVRVLHKLSDGKPQARWLSLAESISLPDPDETSGGAKRFISATLAKDQRKVSSIVGKLVEEYYVKQ